MSDAVDRDHVEPKLLLAVQRVQVPVR